jgi:hypothetical protein
VLNLSDIYIDLKEACMRLLENINLKIRQELFDAPMETLNISQFSQIKMGEKFIKELDSDLKNLINLDNFYFPTGPEEDECMVKTDLKYLNFIKRIEMNMLLESKRRVKTKRLENKEFSQNIDPEEKIIKENSNLILEENKSERPDQLEINQKQEKLSSNSNSNAMNSINTLKPSQNKKIKNSKNNKSCNQNEINIENFENEKKLQTCEKKLQKIQKTKKFENFEKLKITPEFFEAEKNKENFSRHYTEFTKRKSLRSSSEARNKVDEYFDIFKNSEFVNKPIKSLKKKKNGESRISFQNDEKIITNIEEIKNNDYLAHIPILDDCSSHNILIPPERVERLHRVERVDPELTESESESFGNSNSNTMSFSILQPPEDNSIGIKVLHN